MEIRGTEEKAQLQSLYTLVESHQLNEISARERSVVKENCLTMPGAQMYRLAACQIAGNAKSA